jgi:hypothetical protein
MDVTIQLTVHESDEQQNKSPCSNIVSFLFLTLNMVSEVGYEVLDCFHTCLAALLEPAKFLFCC